MKHIDKIKLIINDVNYRIERDRVMTRITLAGNVSANNIWRESGYTNVNGYRRLVYKKTELAIHHIVYFKYHGVLTEGLEINHIDGNKGNNNIDNLELVTPSQNMFHRFRVLGQKGTVNNFKINKKIAEKIRREYRTGKTSYNKLVKKYKLCKTSIALIIKNKTWK